MLRRRRCRGEENHNALDGKTTTNSNNNTSSLDPSLGKTMLGKIKALVAFAFSGDVSSLLICGRAGGVCTASSLVVVISKTLKNNKKVCSSASTPLARGPFAYCQNFPQLFIAHPVLRGSKERWQWWRSPNRAPWVVDGSLKDIAQSAGMGDCFRRKRDLWSGKLCVFTNYKVTPAECFSRLAFHNTTHSRRAFSSHEGHGGKYFPENWSIFYIFSLRRPLSLDEKLLLLLRLLNGY